MKKLLLITLLTISTSAYSAVICRSNTDWSYTAVFPGYQCPHGYFFIAYANQ